MMPLLRKLLRLTHRRRNEADLQAALQFHLDEEAEDRAADGLSTDEARRAARLDLGNLTMVRENSRAAWTWRLPEQRVQDLRYGARALAANKTFSALAILSLALGIGANTAILVAAGLFLRTLSNLESIPLGFNAEHLLTSS